MIHSLLKRHLKKSDLEQSIPPTIEQWTEFLTRVNRAYCEADQERYLLERSLTISSQEMQEAFEQLSKSETRYALAEQGANDGLWDWDLITGDVYYSPRWFEIMGMSTHEGQVHSKNCWLKRIHSDELERVTAELEAHLQGKTDHFQNEHRILHSNGEYRWILIRGFAVRNNNNIAYRIAGSLTDITERKLA